MSTAFILSMFAVAISLGLVFISLRASKADAAKKKDGSDGGATTSPTGSSDDCGPRDAAGCDGGSGD